MKVVITSATSMEWAGINNGINKLYTGKSQRFSVSFHKSGIGILPATFALSKLVIEHQPDLIIQAGIAGAFDKSMPLGKVVAIKNEMLGDVGVEENGLFKDIFDMNLEKADEFPFEKKKLSNSWLEQFNLLKLAEVDAVTISEITTRPERVHQLVSKYSPALESMEGAALHYVGLQTLTPFIQMRSISNFVGERDKGNWRMKEALENLSSTILEYLDKLYKIK